MRVTAFRPLRHRSFRLLWMAQTTSAIGDWLDALAILSLVAFRWGEGAPALAAVSVAMVVPRAALSPLAGVWVDRWSRKATMVLSDLSRAAVVLGMVWAPNLVTLLALIALKAAFSAFFSPAQLATLRATVPDEELLGATSLSQLSAQLAKVVGPALGGVLVAAVGPRPAFALDALTFVASAFFIARLELPRGLPIAGAASPPSGRRFWEELRAGLAHVVGRPTLRRAVACMSAALFIVFLVDSLGVLVFEELGLGEDVFGFAVASIGLGAAAGSVAIGEWGRRIAPLRLLGLGLSATGALVATMGLAVAAGVNSAGVAWVVVYLAIGVAVSAVLVPYSYLLQVETAPELMGRVFATTDSVQTALQLLAPAAGAFLVSALGLGPVFAGAGAALALLGIGVAAVNVGRDRPVGSESSVDVVAS